MVAIKDTQRSMDREEREVDRNTKWQEHVMYGGPGPSSEDYVARKEEDMMVAGDVGDITINLPAEHPPAAPAAEQPKQPWYQRHALPLAMAAGIAGYAGSELIDTEPDQQEIVAPDRAIQFDPGMFEIETVEPGSLTSPDER